MSDVKRQTWWKHRHTLTPGEATLLGVAIGWAFAIVSACTPPRDFTYSFLLILLLSFGPIGGISGYTLWLLSDPVRERRLGIITSLVALDATVWLLVVFADFWRDMGLFREPLMVWMFMGFVWSVTMFAVAAGLGTVHLVGHLASSFRRSTKREAVSQMDGVWDRELDQG